MRGAAGLRQMGVVMLFGGAALVGCSGDQGATVAARAPVEPPPSSVFVPPPVGSLGADETDPAVIGRYFISARPVTAAEGYAGSPVSPVSGDVLHPGLLVMELSAPHCWGVTRVPVRVEDVVTVGPIFGTMLRTPPAWSRETLCWDAVVLIRAVVEDDRLRPGMPVEHYDGTQLPGTVASAHLTAPDLRSVALPSVPLVPPGPGATITSSHDAVDERYLRADAHFGVPRRLAADEVVGVPGGLHADTADVPFPGLLVLEATAADTTCWGVLDVPIDVDGDVATVGPIRGGAMRTAEDGTPASGTCPAPALVRLVVDDERLRPHMTIRNADGSRPNPTPMIEHLTEADLRAMALRRG